MRILHITDGVPPTVLGGTGRIVTELAQSQAARGNAVSIIAPFPTDCSAPSAINDVRIYPIMSLPLRWAHYRSVFSATRAEDALLIVRREQPEIIHAHTVSRQCGYRWMSAVCAHGIRLIVTCHDVSNVAYGKVRPDQQHLAWTEFMRHRWEWNPLRNRMIRHYFTKADAIFTVSDSLRTFLSARGLSGMQTIHNGIDPSFWKPLISREESRKKLNLPSDLPLFLLAGRLGEDKGSSLINRTLSDNAGLILAGSGWTERESTKQNVWAFPPMNAEQMRDLYTAATAVLVPSRCLDCFPTVCLEAMAMERPVLATSWGGAKESVIDGITGWIIDPFDEAGWKSRMEWCARHPADLEQMGKAGRLRIERDFTIDRMADDYDRIYGEVLNTMMNPHA